LGGTNFLPVTEWLRYQKTGWDEVVNQRGRSKGSERGGKEVVIIGLDQGMVRKFTGRLRRLQPNSINNSNTGRKREMNWWTKGKSHAPEVECAEKNMIKKALTI